MNTFTVLASVAPATALLAVAVWRFTVLEMTVRHNSKCQKTLIRAVVKIGRKVNKLSQSTEGVG